MGKPTTGFKTLTDYDIQRLLAFLLLTRTTLSNKRIKWKVKSDLVCERRMVRTQFSLYPKCENLCKRHILVEDRKFDHSAERLGSLLTASLMLWASKQIDIFARTPIFPSIRRAGTFFLGKLAGEKFYPRLRENRKSL